MGKDLLSLLGILAVLLLVLFGCYVFTRWAGTGLSGHFLTPGTQRQMKVLERLAVGKDQALLVVRLANRTFLLGSSPSGFSLLAELTEEEGALWAEPPPSEHDTGRTPPDFQQFIRKFREKK